MTDPTKGDAVIAALEAYEAVSGRPVTVRSVVTLASAQRQLMAAVRAVKPPGETSTLYFSSAHVFALRRKVAQQSETIERLTARAEAAEDKLREAVEVMKMIKHGNATPNGEQVRAFLQSMEGTGG